MSASAEQVKAAAKRVDMFLAYYLPEHEGDEWIVSYNGEQLRIDDLESLLSLARGAGEMREALEPFARFFKSDEHDLSPANDATIVATFLDQETKLPLAELHIADFRRAHKAISEAPDERR